MAFSRFLRFAISGGLNTGVTYGVYLIILQFASYQVSYSIAYLLGIIIAYYLNRSFVFRSHNGVRSILLFPFVYLIQYAFGMLLLWLWVEMAGLSEKFAPLMVVAITLPLTYILSRFVFVGKVEKQINIY